MPTVAIARDDLFAALGQTYTDEEFDELCFEFGIELDEITSEAKMARKERGDDAAKDKSDRLIYKIDVPANRYDLLCLEGMARALNIFLGKSTPPDFRVLEGTDPKNVMYVKNSTKEVRPFVVSAILRGVSFDETSYNSFLDLQDKLHQNICRRRTLVAIGTHDLDTVQGPFTYQAKNPDDIRFVPLFQTREFGARELLEWYNTDPMGKALKPYTHIIQDKPMYPVITDANDVVLSLPPIINGSHSKMSVGTRNVLIECTATDLAKAHVVLNTMITMFCQLSADPLSCESVRVEYEDGRKYTTPDLASREVETAIDTCCGTVGVEIEPEEIVRLASKMQLQAKLGPSEGCFTVTVPPTRSDVLHPIDVIEDVAIAYGYNNIPLRVPPSHTPGSQQPVNHMSDLLREAICGAGYTEVLTHGLCSRAENYSLLRQQDDGKAVAVQNAVTTEFEVVRTSLMPGLLKTLQHNKGAAMREGLRLFEISDVVLQDAAADVGCVNARRVCAVYSGPTAGFELIHGLVDRIMQLMAIQPTEEYAGQSVRNSIVMADAAEGAPRYTIESSEVPTYFPGRSADVLLLRAGQPALRLGHFGVLHPEVLGAFELNFPCSALELDLEPLL